VNGDHFLKQTIAHYRISISPSAFHRYALVFPGWDLREFQLIELTWDLAKPTVFVCGVA